MNSMHAESASPFRLKLECPMTFDCRQELEQSIIYAMRCHQNLEADLSAVQEIDLYGVHLLGLLRSVGAVTAISPVIEEAAKRLLTSYRGASLGRVARDRNQLDS
ncbi:MAG: hypothetical protein H6R15_926 [Proteobacteria bacterium]|nr:hypothetical protein [Pseudomonadota bacterium]